jgi:hypothetical protein
MNDKQLTGNIGLFYACYRLSRYGWNAMPTIRNARGADIFVVSQDGHKVRSIQTKALSGEADVFLGKNAPNPSVNFWIVLMNVRHDDVPKAYIIPADDICKGVEDCVKGINSNDNLVYSDKMHADGSVNCYINAKFLKKSRHDYADAWHIIQ